MTYKKTWLSYLLWAVYTCLTGVMLANYAILFWQKMINDTIGYGTVLFILCVFTAVAGGYFLIRRIYGKIRGKCVISSHTKSLWEAFAAFSLFFAGLLYRISFYLQNTDRLVESPYYRLAMVKADAVCEPMVHGVSYLYTICLSFVLSFLGNRLMAAVWLQILLQMAAVLLTFFTVKRLAGRIPACIAMAALALSSVYVEQILEPTPESLFFVLYLVGMFLVGGFVKNNRRGQGKRSSAVCGALLSGFVIGFLTYLDVISLTLFIFLFGLVCGKRPEKAGKEYPKEGKGRRSTGFSVLLFFLAAAAGGITFIGMLALNAFCFETGLEAMAKMLALFYQAHFVTDYVLYRTAYSVVECFLAVVLAVLLIMAFWNRKKVQNASPWIVLMILLAPTPLTVQGVLPCQVCSIFIWGVLAGIGVQQSLAWENVRVPAEEKGGESVQPADQKEEESEEPQPISSEKAVEKFCQTSLAPAPVETAPSLPQEPCRKPRFLENPLPLPKRHEKRTMDYQYEVTEEQMKFDHEVNEDDDFDIE